MAGLLDQILNSQQAEQDASLSAASRAATWANTFNSVPDAEKIRANQDLTNLVESAIEQKAKLAAEKDIKAQEIYQRAKKFDEWQSQAPQRERLLDARINAQGAHDRFLAGKDAKAAEDIAGFMEHMQSAPDPGTPEYPAYISEGVKKFPHIVGTQVGTDAMKRLATNHQDVLSLTPPEGYVVDNYVTNDSGKTKATFKPLTEKTAVFTGSPEEARAHYGPSADIHETSKGVWTATIKGAKDTIVPSLERERALYATEFAKARRRRTDAEKGGDKYLMDAADNDIREYQGKLSNTESELRSHRAVPASVSQTITQKAIQGPITIKTKEDFAALPSGAEFIDPQGVHRKKP